MWAVSEIAAMATDLAEFLGGAIGLSLLLNIPLWAGMVITGCSSMRCCPPKPSVSYVSWSELKIAVAGKETMVLDALDIRWRDTSGGRHISGSGSA
jgi:hypothetical protein